MWQNDRKWGSEARRSFNRTEAKLGPDFLIPQSLSPLLSSEDTKIGMYTRVTELFLGVT